MSELETAAESHGDNLPKSSVYLKRIKDGYTWSIFVSALEVSEAGMLEAVRLCRSVDAELREVFPTPPSVEVFDVGPSKRATPRKR